MNTRTKIAVAVMAGLVASAAFVGTAYATPRARTGRAYLSRGMMRSYVAPAGPASLR